MLKTLSKLLTVIAVLMVAGIMGEVALRDHAIGATLTNAFASLIHQRDTSCVFQVPVNTSSVTADPRSTCLQWAPAGTIGAGTATLPKGVPDGFIWEFSTTAQVTSMTFAAPTGTSGTITTLQVNANTGKSFRFRSQDAKWYPRY